MYLVWKGDFELERKLPRAEQFIDRQFNPDNLRDKHRANFKYFNILAARLPEIKDIPFSQKLQIAGKGTMLGEEDCFSREVYSCALKCYSTKGTLFEMPIDAFMNLRNFENSWLAVLEKIVQKEHRIHATHLTNKPDRPDSSEITEGSILLKLPQQP